MTTTGLAGACPQKLLKIYRENRCYSKLFKSLKYWGQLCPASVSVRLSASSRVSRIGNYLSFHYYLYDCRDCLLGVRGGSAAEEHCTLALNPFTCSSIDVIEANTALGR